MKHFNISIFFDLLLFKYAVDANSALNCLNEGNSNYVLCYHYLNIGLNLYIKIYWSYYQKMIHNVNPFDTHNGSINKYFVR